MDKKTLESLNNELTMLLESCGKRHSPEKEKEIWLRSFKNQKPFFQLYDYNSDKFEIKYKKFIDRLSQYSEDEQAKFFDFVFKNTPYYSIGHMAINFFKQKQKRRNANLIRHWPKLKTWVTRIDNWAHADMIASLYCDILTEAPEKVLPVLHQWSKTKSPWKNRMAIVSLFYYFNPKRFKPPFKDVEKILTAHLGHEHYYVQKAVGWCLREISSAYPKEYKKFMNKNILKVSSTAFSTSVEKCDKATKEVWKDKRKIARKRTKRS